LPFQLATKNGIGFSLGRITKEEMSIGFMLDLKKLNNTMSFCETIGVTIHQLKKIHRKKRSKGRLKNTNNTNLTLTI
jgi:hypothetical protein